MPAVFLDRDGVLVEATEVDGVPTPSTQRGALELRPGVEEACRQLRADGLLLVCVTNQPDIARGTVRVESVNAANAELQARLGLHAILVCPHDDADDCDCRKPRPGLLIRAADTLGIDLARSVMVGDRWRDVEAGRRAGCATIFIDNGYHERRPDHPDITAGGLDEVVPAILRITMPPPIDREAAGTVNAADLTVEIFADGADVASIVALAANPLIKGFTTNPTLMRAAGVTDYERFAREVVAAVPTMPLSFEVFADDFDGMERQARRIAEWGDNVYAKIPVTDTTGTPTRAVINALSETGVRLNVTALMTVEQVRWVADALAGGPPGFISVFAGRVADTGRDPIPIMVDSLTVMAPHPHLKLIWASPREILNIVQADRIGCHVITVTHDLLKKLSILGTDLDDYSLDTVRMFHRDAAGAGLSL
ncbi:MAG TPA: transaldolase [Candidatus Dormibacteraeota bacterium]|nr:transaldolase [Candidatus Dormibacteraeota bacterium]